MKTCIGVIDDREDARTSFKRRIELVISRLQLDCTVVDSDPFEEMSDYFTWINENGIGALITDERLDSGPISYSGHELVEHLRKTLIDFPIFAVTNFSQTQDLQDRFQLFNLILSREDFDEREEEYTNLFVKSASDFYAKFRNQLERLAAISTMIAQGDRDPELLKEAQGIQELLQIPLMTNYLNDREFWLEEYDTQIGELNALIEKIQLHIGRK